MNLDLQKLELVERMSVGEKLTFHGRKGWQYEITKVSNDRNGEFDLRSYNPNPKTRQSRWFEIDTSAKVSQYGAPVIVQEPDLGIALRKFGINIESKLIGALVLDNMGSIVERFSWSNLVFMKEQTFSISTEGELEVDQSSKGFLSALFLADKERIKGYVGIFVPTKPEKKVKILEMEDLLVSTLSQL